MKCGAPQHGEKRKLRYEDVKKEFVEHGCVLLEEMYVRGDVPMKYKCVCGIEARICWDNFKQGQRCNECGKQKRSGVNNPNWILDRDVVAFNRLLGTRYKNALLRTLKLTGKTKSSKSEEMLRHSRQELRDRIIKHPLYNKIKDGRWSIDHIFPVVAFIRHCIFDCRLINCLDNLRPLLLSENVSKHDGYNEDDFLFWLNTKGITNATSN